MATEVLTATASKQTNKQTDRQTDRQTNRQTNKQTDRQVNQTDKQTDRQVNQIQPLRIHLIASRAWQVVKIMSRGAFSRMPLPVSSQMSVPHFNL